jgi:hypothetical protein
MKSFIGQAQALLSQCLIMALSNKLDRPTGGKIYILV